MKRITQKRAKSLSFFFVLFKALFGLGIHFAREIFRLLFCSPLFAVLLLCVKGRWNMRKQPEITLMRTIPCHANGTLRAHMWHCCCRRQPGLLIRNRVTQATSRRPHPTSQPADRPTDRPTDLPDVEAYFAPSVTAAVMIRQILSCLDVLRVFVVLFRSSSYVIVGESPLAALLR